MNILVASLPLSATPNDWCRLATTGEWKGYPAGARKLDAADLASCAAFHAEANAGKTDVVIDYDHATLKAIAGTLDPKMADAAGWVEAVDVRAGGAELWIKPRWTAAAQAKIEAGERRYLSPVIMFGYAHPVSGAEQRAVLHSVALTNTPFFRHLGGVSSLAASDAAALLADEPHTPPKAFRGFATDFLFGQGKAVDGAPWGGAITVDMIPATDLAELRTTTLLTGLNILTGKRPGRQACDVQGFRFNRDLWTREQARAWLDEHGIQGEFLAATQEATDVDLKKLLALLRLAEDGTEADCEAKIKALMGEGEKAKDEKAEAVAATATVAPEVAKLIGVEPTADLAAVTAAVEKIKTAGGTPAPPAAEPGVAIVATATALGIADPEKAHLADVLKRIGELGVRIEGTAAAQLVDEAVKKGKISPANKPWWLKQAAADLDGTKAIIASMPAIIGTATIAAPAGEAEGGVALTEAEIEVGRQAGYTPDQLLQEKKRRLGK